jgi:8-oxo-dGTP pyrophosphatase MutT (NUDIX family)
VKTRREVSAGGVIYRQVEEALEVCLIATQGGKTWQLPKGIIEDGEPPEETALREVSEETGLQGDIVANLGKIEYWYVDTYTGPDPIRVSKRVYFYLLRCTGGSTEDHDDEVEQARWFPLEQAPRRLSFENERKVVRKAAEALAAGLASKE